MQDNLNNGIYTIDAHYAREQLAAVFMLVEGNQVALIETANAKSLPYVKAELAKHGLIAQDVKYIFLTHIDLFKCIHQVPAMEMAACMAACQST